MNGQLTFVALAASMAALAVGIVLPPVWRALSCSVPGRRAWIASAAFAFVFAALAFGLYGLRGDWAATASGRSALSEQLLEAERGLQAGRDVSGQLRAELERHLQRQPSDARALVLKARLEMRAERYEQAAAAFEKAVAGGSKAAKDPGVWVEYAEARSMAQGRTLLGAPQQLVQNALALDAQHAQALDLAGSAAWEMGDFANAALYWERLLAQIPPESPRHAELSQAIARAQQRARFSLPPSVSGFR